MSFTRGVTFQKNHMANDGANDGIRRVSLGVSGGIAAYKAVEVLRGLQRAGCKVRVAMSARSCEFIKPLTFRALTGEHVIVDDYAPDNPDPIAHITFTQTTDLFLIAPATANIIAKFANGVADDFLTSTYLASTAPVLIAPAMNTTMLNHPATQRNLQRLRDDGVRIIEPDAGEMACGTIGPGRLSEPERIVSAALQLLDETLGHAEKDLSGETVLITAGATREEIDPVRFLSNRSSGRMGFALAEAARARGATVTIVAGETNASPPSRVRFIKAVSSEQMHAAVMQEIGPVTVFIGAAAVADYKPAERSFEKIKKSGGRISLSLEPTTDILYSVSKSRHNGLIVVGFAAESTNVIEHARQKLEQKQLDLIVANDITRDGAGFDVDTNVVSLIARNRKLPIDLPLMSKLQVAHRVLDEVVRLRHERMKD